MTTGKVVITIATALLWKTVTAQPIQKKDLIADIDEYRSAINSLHVNPYSLIPKHWFYHEIDTLKEKAPSMDVDEVLVRLMQVNADINDTHTRLQYVPQKVFPIKVRHYKEGYIIVSADMYVAGLYGAKILGIDGLPIDTITGWFTSVVPGYNYNRRIFVYSSLLADPMCLHGLHITHSRDEAVYKIEATDGTIEEVRVKAMPFASIRQFVPHSRRTRMIRYSLHGNYSYAIFDSIGYMRYTQCLEDPHYSMDKFLRQFRRACDSGSVRKIVIDLRDNGGGHEKLLGDYMPDFSTIGRLGRHRRIYLLIGKGTFSAAGNNAARFRQVLGAKLVGEETGGDANHFGAIDYFTLPHTQIKVSYSQKRIVREPGNDGGIKPDVYVDDKFEDYLAGRDAALEYVVSDQLP